VEKEDKREPVKMALDSRNVVKERRKERKQEWD